MDMARDELNLTLPSDRPLRIGLISDTHGLLRPEALEALQDVDAILHAGDVGREAILDALAQLAPVLAVRGNVDAGSLAALPERALLRVGALAILMLHNLQQLGSDPLADRYQVVVSGHTHRAAITTRDGMLAVNPGSAGPRRFRLPLSVALLTIDGARVRPQIVWLPIP